MAHLYVDKQRNGFILFLAKDLSVPAYSGCSWAILRYDSPLRRRGKKPGLKPLPHDLKCKRITITLAPKYRKQVVAHKSPDVFVEYCISLARLSPSAQKFWDRLSTDTVQFLLFSPLRRFVRRKGGSDSK
jgi:hypothetical protein